MSSHPAGGHGFVTIDFKDDPRKLTAKQAAKRAQQDIHTQRAQAPSPAAIGSVDLMEDPGAAPANQIAATNVSVRPAGQRVIIDVEVPGTIRGDEVAHQVIMQVEQWAKGLIVAANVSRADHFCCVTDMGP